MQNLMKHESVCWNICWNMNWKFERTWNNKVDIRDKQENAFSIESSSKEVIKVSRMETVSIAKRE